MKRIYDFLWILVLMAIIAFLLVPVTNNIFNSFNDSHPYLMGFIKFCILASMGELLALRILAGRWEKTKGMFVKAVVWGIIGMMIVFMFKLYPAGVSGLISGGILFGGSGVLLKLLSGFYTSAFMNLTFAPVFMSVHRISNTCIEARFAGEKKSIGAAIDEIDWPGFIKFVVAKTIPFFWIPMHTIVFLLPENYRVICAAFLSIALGVILALAQKKQ